MNQRMVEYYDIIDSQEYADSGREVDLLVCTSSPEIRCTRVPNLLTEGSVRKAVILHYNDPYATKERDENLKTILQALDTKRVLTTVHECSFANPADGVRGFRELLETGSTHPESILLDMTTLTKAYLCLLLRVAADEYGLGHLDVAYTEPLAYPRGKAAEAVFTEGLRATDSMPGFFGRYNSNHRNLLVVLLGFEGDRAVQVYRHVAPDYTIAVNGFPAYRVGWEDRSLMANEDFLEESAADIRLAPAADPYQVHNCLERIREDLGGSHNMHVSPLGTKPQALGACMFAMQHDDVKLVYPFPQTYRPKPAESHGPSRVFRIPLMTWQSVIEW